MDAIRDGLGPSRNPTPIFVHPLESPGTVQDAATGGLEGARLQPRRTSFRRVMARLKAEPFQNLKRQRILPRPVKMSDLIAETDPSGSEPSLR